MQYILILVLWAGFSAYTSAENYEDKTNYSTKGNSFFSPSNRELIKTAGVQMGISNFRLQPKPMTNNSFELMNSNKYQLRLDYLPIHAQSLPIHAQSFRLSAGEIVQDPKLNSKPSHLTTTYAPHSVNSSANFLTNSLNSLNTLSVKPHLSLGYQPLIISKSDWRISFNAGLVYKKAQQDCSFLDCSTRSITSESETKSVSSLQSRLLGQRWSPVLRFDVFLPFSF